MLNFLQSRLLERAAKRSFFLRDTFHRGGIRVFTFLGGLEIEFLRFLINILILVVSLSAGDVATCDGVGGVDGLPSPPVVGIRVAPEVWELPPAAPEVWELPPAAPEIPVLAQPLIPDLQRQDELYRRFLVNTLGENPTLRRITETVSVQSQMEGLMEAALIHLGFNPTSIVSNRHRIRGILFYPQGRALSLRQYRSHLRSIYRLGTRDTRAFQRILTAVRNSDLFL
uniref:Uncharacterized protein LOC101489699 isoform X5 n=1 Tax=Cicer arietinum TaxID=3827 RepID=A0A1S2Z0E6_CICAR|nr:uncharacterized protein LOC101489699 isoform X5 [Cicer arietinum]